MQRSIAKLLIEARHGDEVRMALRGVDGKLSQYAVERAAFKPSKGNIYLAKVERVEPGLQAAFVDYGGSRNGFLPFAEINPDYYRIPVADRQKAEEEGERRRYVIQDVISPNRMLLVQVSKDERGSKGAALTTYLSLASRYCVLLPNSRDSGGISRQVEDPKERKRLKDIQNSLGAPEGMSVIFRTAALRHSKEEISEDYQRLAAMWDKVRNRALESKGTILLHEDADLLSAAIRDYCGDDVQEIVTDDEKAHQSLLEAAELLMPDIKKRIKLHKGSRALFAEEGVAEQVEELYVPEVALGGGGTLVINQSEAMISIDVNSGRSTRHRHLEDTAFTTNMEAAKEIARQLRLRDLGGLVVIDFIDMSSRSRNAQVERTLWDALRHDKARVQAGRITRFGLLEMTRQRLGLNLQERLMQKCPHCNGSGWIRSKETGSVEVLRRLEEQLGTKKAAGWRISLPADQALHFLNTHRNALAEMEKKHDTKLEVGPDQSLLGDAFELEPLEEGAESGGPSVGGSDPKSKTKPPARRATARKSPTRKTPARKSSTPKPPGRKPPGRKPVARKTATGDSKVAKAVGKAESPPKKPAVRKSATRRAAPTPPKARPRTRKSAEKETAA